MTTSKKPIVVMVGAGYMDVEIIPSLPIGEWNCSLLPSCDHYTYDDVMEVETIGETIYEQLNQYGIYLDGVQNLQQLDDVLNKIDSSLFDVFVIDVFGDFETPNDERIKTIYNCNFNDLSEEDMEDCYKHDVFNKSEQKYINAFEEIYGDEFAKGLRKNIAKFCYFQYDDWNEDGVYESW